MKSTSVTQLASDQLDNCNGPSDEAIYIRMLSTDEPYYTARERLREEAYGGKPPSGYQSWGDYWKSR